MVNLAAVCANIQGGTVILPSKYVQGCTNTGLLVLWLWEQHTKPGCLGELGRQEAPQCLAFKEKMCFVNWLTFQTIYLLTECIVFAKASWKDSYSILWFNPQYATESNSLLGISHELDNMFPSIKVLHDFTRKPCSIAEFNTGKHQNFICLPSLLDCHVFNQLYFLSLCTILLFISCTQFLFPNLV